MSFVDLAGKRYSCRNLTDKKIEKEKIDAIMEAGILAPTAVNKQAFKIFLLESDQAKDLVHEATRFTFGADTFLLIGASKEEAWQRSFDGKNFAEIDAAIVATHLMLAIEDQGLATTWVGHFDPAILQAGLEELKDYELIAIFPLGYPAEGAEPSARHYERKTREDLVKLL